MNLHAERLVMKGMVTVLAAAPVAFMAFSEGGIVNWILTIVAGICGAAFFTLAVIQALMKGRKDA